ncbi:RNA polymerase sigma-70 factor (ECF subfamily) [Salirhabdus euzebyi]|uniref:RNA polymerase sigma factor n=1 Tax=Salirhabdus euzebyi TaxID=394506 RepID=A0A841QAL0_9BACI|nr:RNA polymerase sigma factor [Salirhabdus euzebyi]MBB6455324.1 RNA polymerase sigma-70 factor (ECF subfamily) [Salirhabdus euzebyi]
MIDNDELVEQWFRMYADEMYNFLVYYTGSTEVEDLVQEVFIKVIHSIDSFREESNPKTWLFKIARNVSIDEARRNRRKLRKLIRYERESTTIKPKTPEAIFELKEDEKELVQQINCLKDSYRDVLLVKGMKEFSTTETATILNWTENKVRVTYHRALKALRRKVEKIEE